MKRIRFAAALALIFVLGFTAVVYSVADPGAGGSGAPGGMVSGDNADAPKGKAPKGRVSPSAPSVSIIRKDTNAGLENANLALGTANDNFALRISGATAGTVSWSSSDSGVFTVSGDASGGEIQTVSEGFAYLQLSVTTAGGDTLSDRANVSVYTAVDPNLAGSAASPADVYLGAGTAATLRGGLPPGQGLSVIGKCGAYYFCDFFDGTLFPDNVASTRGHILKTKVSIPATGSAAAPAYADMAIGKTAKFSATVTPGLATDKTVSWTSGNPAVATVNSKGKAAGRSEGTAAVTATPNTGSGSSSSAATVYTPISKVRGSSKKFTGNAIGAAPTWHSGDGTSPAAGLTGGKKVTISGQCGGFWRIGKSRYVMKSDISIPVSGISIDRASAALLSGGTLALRVTKVLPKEATDKTVTWRSSNTKVAEVAPDGKVAAKKAGSARITAVSSNPRKTASCKITVKQNKTKLDPPSAVSAASGGDKKAKISWGAVPGAAGYTVYRASSPSGSYAKIANVGAATSYTHKAGYAEYWYRVSARSMAGAKYDSGKSAAARFNTLMPPVLKSVLSKSGKAVLKWGKAGGADSYAVYRASGSIDGAYRPVTTVSKRAFTDKKGTGNTKYYYKLKSVRKLPSGKNLVSDGFSGALRVGEDTSQKVKSITLSDPGGGSESCRIELDQTVYLKVKIAPNNAYNKKLSISVIRPADEDGDVKEIVSVIYDKGKSRIAVTGESLSFFADGKPAKIVVKSTDGGGAKASYKVWVDAGED